MIEFALENSVAILLILFGIAISLLLNIIDKIVYAYHLYKRLKTTPALIKYADKDLCEGPHEYSDLKININKEVLETNYCRVCGFVAQTPMRLNKIALERANLRQ